MQKDRFSLKDKTAVITGGSRGIGKAITKEFLRRGAHIAIASRNLAPPAESSAAQSPSVQSARAQSSPDQVSPDQSLLQELMQECPDKKQNITTHRVDVSDSRVAEDFKNAVLQQHERVDILVNNAGVSPVYVPMERITQANWEQLVSINLAGVFHCCQAFGSHMLQNHSGSIINISSVAGHVGLAKQAAYAASKGGVEQLSKSMALDWAKKGIRVNTIAYGFVETDLTQALRNHDTLSKSLLDKTPSGRFAKVEETTGAAVFLASDASSYVTGTSIIVDGGWTAA